MKNCVRLARNQNGLGVVFVCGLTLCLIGHGVNAWGGLFNRFSPEMLQNLGYGGNGYSQPAYLQRSNTDEDNVFGELESNLPDDCFGRRCSANEYCCPGSLCVDVDGTFGTCVFFEYGRRSGELCHRDSDCESGLLCGGAVGSDGGARVCQPPAFGDKQYGELCQSSQQCDIVRGLCCLLQRRHRQEPRKVCSYFQDPLICIGPVATDQIKFQVEHTKGEKRIPRRSSLNPK